MSAYGVEVPLVLDADEAHKVFQYYVPFLSGLQIFRAAEVNPGDGDGDGTTVSSPRMGKRRPRRASPGTTARPW